MALDPTAFKARWTEFAALPDGLVLLALNEASARCDVRVFGTATIDQAVGLLAAHLLSVSPQGQQARLESDAAMTTYLLEWKRLARARAGGPWITGMRP